MNELVSQVAALEKEADRLQELEDYITALQEMVPPPPRDRRIKKSIFSPLIYNIGVFRLSHTHFVRVEAKC